MKRCFACKQEKPLSEFYRSNVRYYQNECKVCNKERKYRWHKSPQGKRSTANTKLKGRFGITLEEYEQMLKAQDSKCLICDATKGYLGHQLAVDHCHKTGKIRGLLCKGCNIGIGNLQDSPKLLIRAAEYLQKHKV